MINNQFQNIALNWILEKIHVSNAMVVTANILTSFNMTSFIQTLLLQSGKYKLYLFIMYVLLI